MTTLGNAKMSSLKDKIEAKAEAPAEVAEVEETKEEVKPKKGKEGKK